jgi:hypothetical protein
MYSFYSFRRIVSFVATSRFLTPSLSVYCSSVRRSLYLFSRKDIQYFRSFPFIVVIKDLSFGCIIQRRSRYICVKSQINHQFA